MEFYRGNDFYFDIGAELEEDGSVFEFNVGDIIKVGIKDKLSNTNYVLFKEIEVTEKTDTISIHFTNEETKKFSEGDKILEVELTEKLNGAVSTIYQDKLTIKGEVIK